MNISLFNTYVDPEASEMVSQVLRSTFISEGEQVRSFEEKLETELGISNCITVNSGTSALHLALVLAGIEEGDEVIIPAQTFVATGLVILQQKAIPVFADIDYSHGNISIESIRNKISTKTKAILPVHWGGYPCDMDEITQLAKDNNLVVIEDAAHALGATYKNKPIGTISDYTCFSFQAIKHVTTGDGGAVCTHSSKKYKEAVAARWFGIDRNRSTQTLLGERSYNIEKPGYKYHLNDYAAALGLANLTNFPDRLRKRISIADFYRVRLAGLDGIQLFNYRNDRQSAFWLFGFHVERRNAFIQMMKACGISTSVVHQRIDRNAVFGGLKKDLVNQSRFDDSQIHIPIHDGINMEKAEYIVESIRRGW